MWWRNCLSGRSDSSGHIQEEFEERVVDFLVIRLEFWLDVYDERGGYGRK